MASPLLLPRDNLFKLVFKNLFLWLPTEFKIIYFLVFLPDTVSLLVMKDEEFHVPSPSTVCPLYLLGFVSMNIVMLMVFFIALNVLRSLFFGPPTLGNIPWLTIMSHKEISALRCRPPPLPFVFLYLNIVLEFLTI